MFKKSIALGMACAMINLSVSAATPLERGKGLSVRLTSEISSKHLEKANPAKAIVYSDVKSADGKVLIKSGTPVRLELSGKKAKGAGKAGYVEATCASTMAVDGQEILLDGGTSAEGDERRMLAIGLGVGLGLTFLFGFGFLFTLIKGRDAAIPAGTVIRNVFVANDYIIQ